MWEGGEVAGRKKAGFPAADGNQPQQLQSDAQEECLSGCLLEVC